MCRGAQGCSQECLEAELLKEEEIPAMARALILWLPHTPFVAIGKKPNWSTSSWESSQHEVSWWDCDLRVSLTWHRSAAWSSLPRVSSIRGMAQAAQMQTPCRMQCPRQRDLLDLCGTEMWHPWGWLYLLSRMASSTWVLFSDTGAPREVWLMADRNFSSNLVLSVFPAPLSPLLKKIYTFHSQIQDRRANDHPTRGRGVISRNKHVAFPLQQARVRQRVGQDGVDI